MKNSTIRLWLLFIIAWISGKNAEAPRKIVGGTFANIWDTSFQASLLAGDRHFCSGSIIGESHILTAASCIVLETGVFQANIKVLSGTTDLQYKNRLLHDVSIITVHEDYNPEDFWINDIAVLKLATPLPLSGWRSIIALADRLTKPRNLLNVAGWGGMISPLEDSTRFLRKIKMNTLNRIRCRDYFGLSNELPIQQNCAMPIRNTSTVSKGDGGGPMESHHQVFGILSFSELTLGSPVMYTEVFPYKEWITDIITAT